MSAALEVLHWLALAPLAFLLAFRRGVPAAFWIVALAFSVSFSADVVADLTGGSWVATPWYQIVQFGLFALAFFADGGPSVVPAVLLYVGLGSAFYLAMMPYASPATHAEFMRWWYPYQGVRLLAFALFGWSAWRHGA